ncbi:MAG: DUF262 domain-containing protein [Acidimicrobiales bacterium]|nr:DUF262 domain-containing protein [Acidimicrobiales bacterium]MYD34914.1 DUF262 domain-containing protein [Acidimicrobiales bacterium]MYI09161.1 DUF262 domain-containing protein [Acidimicrobiales bacterium]
MPSIAELLFDAERRQIHIPDFQRPWVWNKNQVRDLFTSLYRRYPVGAMVFWPNRINGDQRHSLIDGRQRLTALYNVIRGQRPWWMRETPSEFAQPLRFNVVDEEFGYLSDKRADDARWVNVSDAFVVTDFLECFDSAAASLASDGRVSHAAVVERIARLRDITQTHINKEVLPENLDTDRAVEVFEILNRAGTKVREADLVVARLSLVWPEVRESLDKALGRWEESGFRVPTEAVLRCLSAVVADTVHYEGLYGSQGDRESPPTEGELVAGFYQLVDATDAVLTMLRGRLGLSRTRPTVLNRGYVPVVYAAQRHAAGELLQVELEAMIGWWQLSNLHNHWSSDVRNRLEDAITALRNGNGVAQLVGLLGKPGRSLALEPIDFRTKRKPSGAEYRLLLTMTKRCGAMDLPSGESLSFDHIGEQVELEAHHIFPTAYLTKQSGVREEEIDQLANIAFITKKKNLKIGPKSPTEYLGELADESLENLRSQWIPTDRALWRPGAYSKFLEQRSRLLAEQANDFLRGLLGEEAWEAAKNR